MTHILLIDDDELLRDTLLQMLQLDGHRVTAAAGGEQGLALFGSGAGFDAVVTDMLMPTPDGAQVIVELHRRCPAMPVVAISGGRRLLTPRFNLETAAVSGATCQLAKPFTRVQLRAVLEQALAAPAPR